MNMANPLQLRRLGNSDVEVTQLGFGTGPLGGARRRVSDADAEATVDAAVDAGINYFDTAPWYGVGQAELHLGQGLLSRRRPNHVVSTKVGRVLFPANPTDLPFEDRWPGGAPNDLRFDYTRSGVLQSLEHSLQRLRMERVDVLVIHDLDYKFHHDDEGVNARLRELNEGGGYEALRELKASGVIGALGAGINMTGMIERFLQDFDLDFFLVAMPYTLMDQAALEVELPLCEERGVSVVVGAPFCSGLLAPGENPSAWYGYQPADRVSVERAQGIGKVCARHGVSLGAAALQFPFGHPAVVAVIPGPESLEHVRSNIELMREPIPAELWDDLKGEGLLLPEAPTPVGA
jgi:D-threo-aldose 1-dehydrogenase